MPKDIQTIKKYLLEFRMDKFSPNIEYFGFSKLPTWLDIYYESKQDDLLNIALGIIPTEDQNKQKTNSSATAAAGGNPKDPFPFLGPKNIRKSVANYIIQNYYKKHNQPYQYLFVKKGAIISSKQLEEIQHILFDEQSAFTYIKYIDENDLDPKLQYIIIPANYIINQNQFDLDALDNILNQKKGNPNLNVIVVFDDKDKNIPSDFTIPNSIKNLVIAGSNLDSIGDKFLYKCKELTSLELPESITSIGSYFLYGCTELKSIKLSDSLISIGSYFLYKCSNLTELELPKSLNSIDPFFLQGCYKLKKIYIDKVVLNKLKESNSFQFFLINNSRKQILTSKIKN